MSEETLLKLPLDGWHRAKGARMVGFAGYEMPIHYEGIMAEHEWTRQSAGLFDVSHMGQLQLIGPDVATKLEAIVPGDISALKIGKMRYSLLLAPDGGVLDDLMITNIGSHLYVVVNGAVKHEDIAFMRNHLPDDVEIVYGKDVGLLALQGPKAMDAIARLGIAPLHDGWPVPTDLYFMEAGPFLWGDVPLGISRSGYTGEDGFEISVASEYIVALADALCAQPEVKPIGLGARDSLRLEAGLPLYGHDMDPSTDPVEANASFAVSKRRREEGGFHGSERILKALSDGPTRKLVGLSIEGKMPVREGAFLFSTNPDDTEIIGKVTSGGFAPSVGAPIAMGYVGWEFLKEGTVLHAVVCGKRVPVTVTAMPFIPHTYHRRGKAQ